MNGRFYFILILLISNFFLHGCTPKESSQKTDKQPISRDLDAILEDGVLNAVTTYSSTSYFLYKGRPMGYEYELLKRFAKHLNVELKLKVTNDIDTMYHWLNTGKVDLIAHGLTITNERKKRFHFSEYLYLTRQVLVQRKPTNWRKMRWSDLQRALKHDVIELIGDTVSVRNNSSYMHRLKNLSDELGGTIFIDTLPANLSTEQIIDKVAEGEIKYTVADDNIANIYASYNPILDISVPISFSQRVAWAVRPNAPKFEQALNQWIAEMKKEVAYYYIYNKYFKHTRDFRLRENSPYFSLNNNRISEYDELIKSYAKTLNWDWRLLASMIYQESQFNPESESWAGAKGIMQLMPETAERYGVKDLSDPNQTIKAGTEILKVLWDRFSEIPDSVQRIKFTLAAYNCGYGHITDAQTLARLEGYNPLVWDENVDEMILKLSYPEYYNRKEIKYGYVRGLEPHSYVKEIFTRYEHYKRFIK